MVLINYATGQTGQDSQIKLCDMSGSKPKNRNADNGESPTAATATPFPSIPLHLVRLFWTIDGQSWKKQDDQTLWRNLHVPQFPSCPPGNCDWLLCDGIYPNTKKILFKTWVSSRDLEWNRRCLRIAVLSDEYSGSLLPRWRHIRMGAQRRWWKAVN